MAKRVQFAIKRGIDIVGASFGLLVTSPLSAFAAIGTFVTIGCPIFFRQVRPGINAQPLTLTKFRTMRNAFGPDGTPRPDHERITPFGAFLRKFSIDEIPQLVSVVKGDLSLVGPRPLLMQYIPLYTPEQSRRHEVRPGISGWAQVNGRNAISWENKFELDVWYVDNWSLWLDIKILWLTVIKVLRGSEINEPGHVTMREFTGLANCGSREGVSSSSQRE